MDKKFFLILSASGGAGHLRAAEALHRASQDTRFPIRTQHFDILDFTTSAFKRLYAQSYLAVVNKAPELWGYLYQRSESKPYRKKGLLKIFDRLNYGRYIQTLRSLDPDAVICTHFLPFIAISDRTQKENIRLPFFAATTDFDVHQLWIDDIVKRYYVYHEESAWQLRARGIPVERISVKGIPIMPEFGKKEPQNIIRRKLGLSTNTFTTLVLSGGFGVGRIEEIVDSVSGTLAFLRRRQFTLLIVCGRNEKVRMKLERRNFPPNIHARIYGFVETIHELMDASDILISKSGGLTSSESMAKSLPMIIVDPIPGQESRNSDVIVEHGAGWKAINLANLSYKLSNVLQSPRILRDARNATTSLAKPHAAKDILEDVYRLTDHDANRRRRSL